MSTHRGLDRTSRDLLAELAELKRLERMRSRMARDSPESRDLDRDIETTSRHVWEHAAARDQAGVSGATDPVQRTRRRKD